MLRDHARVLSAVSDNPNPKVPRSALTRRVPKFPSPFKTHEVHVVAMTMEKEEHRRGRRTLQSP